MKSLLVLFGCVSATLTAGYGGYGGGASYPAANPQVYYPPVYAHDSSSSSSSSEERHCPCSHIGQAKIKTDLDLHVSGADPKYIKNGPHCKAFLSCPNDGIYALVVKTGPGDDERMVIAAGINIHRVVKCEHGKWESTEIKSGDHAHFKNAACVKLPIETGPYIGICKDM